MNYTDYKKKISLIIENSNSNYLGIFFSLFIHLMILLFAIGLPDFFKPRPISLPVIIPIEIINVSESTSIPEKEIKNNNENIEKKIVKQKKFNSSENTEIKKVELQEQPKITKKENPEIITKKEIEVSEKIKVKKIEKPKVEKPKFEKIEKVESLNTTKIKPKLKPKPEFQKQIENKPVSDVQIKPQPQLKPEPDFNIASMLKDLRNEKSNMLKQQNKEEKKNDISNSEIEKPESENMTLSISEMDLVLQQLRLCWNAPAGAKVTPGMMVKVSAKIQENRRVIENSIRIVDTNISKSDAMYVPITESAMRTFLHPDCTPLKLPEDKYKLWKNFSIIFDFSIMKGYSE